jgi:hypothetical protein
MASLVEVGALTNKSLPKCRYQAALTCGGACGCPVCVNDESYALTFCGFWRVSLIWRLWCSPPFANFSIDQWGYPTRQLCDNVERGCPVDQLFPSASPSTILLLSTKSISIICCKCNEFNIVAYTYP